MRKSRLLIFLGYFHYSWSHCSSGKTSSNGMKATALLLIMELNWSSQVWPTQQRQPLGKTNYVQTYLPPSSMFHLLNYTTEMIENITLLWNGLWKRMTWLNIKLHEEGVSINHFPMPWQWSVLLWANFILYSQAIRILGSVLSQILKVCYQVDNIKKSSIFLLHWIFYLGKVSYYY